MVDPVTEEQEFEHGGDLPPPTKGKQAALSPELEPTPEDQKKLINDCVNGIVRCRKKKKELAAEEKGFFTTIKQNGNISVKAVQHVLKQRELDLEYRRAFVQDCAVLEKALGMEQIDLFGVDINTRGDKEALEHAVVPPKGATGNPAALKAVGKKAVVAVAKAKSSGKKRLN